MSPFQLFIRSFRKIKHTAENVFSNFQGMTGKPESHFPIPNTFFYAYNVCRDKTLRQCSYHLFSSLSYDYFIQIYYENKFTFLVYFPWKVCEMASKGNYVLHFFIPETFCRFNSISIFWKVLSVFMHQAPWKIQLSNSCIPWTLLIFISAK